MNKSFRDVITEGPCKGLFKEVNDYCTCCLSAYNARMNALEVNSSVFKKDIFDFVWGTVELEPHEILLLDSPLLQRLRYIKQLGLADMLYCNATSTRFSHTIGVIEVSGRMAKKVSIGLELSGNIEKELIQIVRLSALFHDVGHMFYSHVSEKYFTNDVSFPKYELVHKALVHVQTEIKRTYNCALHELIGAMIVQSDAVGELLNSSIIRQSLAFQINKPKDVSYLQDCISSLILGSAINQVLLPFSTIIKGTVDADRIDYLSRDSSCTKVPISVDASRLIQKILVVDYRENDPKANFSENSAWDDDHRLIKEYFPGWKNGKYKIMVIKNSATKVCFQLDNARLNMYESVYCHHKVLTAETMMREVISGYFEKCGELGLPISFKTILSWSDEVFSEHWRKIANVKGFSKEDKARISDTIVNIRNRNLYKRVAAFSERDLDDFSATTCGKRRFFNEVVKDNAKNQMYRNQKALFCDCIKEEYKSICAKIGNPIKDSENYKFVFVSISFTSIDPIPIDDGNGSYDWSNELYKYSTIDEGKKSQEEKFYLLSNCEHRECAYLAFEKVLFEKYSIRLNKRAAKCLKSDYSALVKTKGSLFQNDYYRNCLCLVDDDLFFGQGLDPKIRSVVEKYGKFEAHDSRQVDELSVRNFLRQFNCLQIDYVNVLPLLNGILDFMLNGYFVGRELIRNVAENCWFKDLSDTVVNMCVVGSPTDSSLHLSYYMNDLKTTLQNKNVSLRIETDLVQCLKNTKNGECIFFYDDGSYSGKQITSIFQEYVGIDTDKRNTKESHVSSLKKSQIEMLEKRNIHLLFVLGNSNNESYIKEELRKIGLYNIEVSYQYDMKDSAFNTLQDRHVRKLVIDSLKTIGKQLIKEKKTGHSGWDNKRINAAALGYNNAQQMVVTSVSVPTYTVPAFWVDGTFNGRKWKSLFTRLEDKIDRNLQSNELQS